MSYHAYWKSVVLNFMIYNPEQHSISINGMADATGMCPHDIASTLHRLGMIERDPDTQRWRIHRRSDLISAHEDKEKKSTRFLQS